jgi:lipopolysaccharide biosynthesis regulator YciM
MALCISRGENGKTAVAGTQPCVWALAPGNPPDEAEMSEKVGEMARESSDYRCEQCHQVTHIARGDLIPACPNCGFGTYDISNPRFENKQGVPHEPG